MASTAEDKLTACDKFFFGLVYTNLSAEIMQKEPLLVPKTRFYSLTTKSQKNSGIC
jgi:hypothetical protein